METVIRKTTWLCTDGHSESMSEDLGDPADREQVSRVEEDVFCGGCRIHINGKRCEKKARRTFSDETHYE